MYGAPATPKAARLESWPRYMTTPTSASFPTDSVDSSHLPTSTPTKNDSFQSTPSASTPNPYHSSARPTAPPSPPPAVSPYIGRQSLRTRVANQYPAPYSVQQQYTDSPHQQQTASPPLESSMPYPTTPSPPSYGISGGSLIVSEPHIIQPSHTQSCNPSIAHDVFMSAPPFKPRSVLRPTLSHNGNGVYISQPASTWPRRMMPPTESNERTRSSTDDTTMSPPLNPPSLLTTTAPTGTTYAAPPPPQQQAPRSEQTGLSVVRGQGADQAHPQHGHAASSAAMPQFASSLPLPPLPSIHNPSSYGAPPPPFATQPPPAPTHYPDNVPYQPAQYDAIPSYSPWPAHSSLPSQSDLHAARPHPGYSYHPQPPQNQYWSQATTKMDEPLLAPGELPAPRPPMSYAALIGEALLMAPPPHQLYVAEIGDSIKRRYTYYRQNPSKVYNGVRHQTSMCKAFVKLPRPYGDQSGGARKWAIRAGCDSWFHSGGYHPPPANASPSVSHTSVKKSASVSGKAKATARAKKLAIGSASPPETPRQRRLSYDPFSPSSGQGGPSIGAAFDGSGRPTWTQAPAPQSPPAPSAPIYQMPHPSHAAPPHGHYLPPPPGMPYPPQGYHYVPIPQQHHQSMHAQYPPHPQHYQHQPQHQGPGGQPMYVPVFGAYPHHSPAQQYIPTPVSAMSGQYQQGPGSQDSEQWEQEGEQGQGQGQGRRQEEYQHSSPGSMTSHHSNGHHQSPPSV